MTTNSQIMDIFRSLDSASNLEHPLNFKKEELAKQVHRFKEAFERKFGTCLHLDDSIEDASFFADLVLGEKNVNGTICRFSIRFSNFGQMACLPLEGYEKEEEVVNFIKDSDFIFVPNELLDKKYDGVFSDKETVPNWGIRFFDYF